MKPAKEIKVDVILGQSLGQIRPNVVKKVRKQILSIGFFHILQGEYLLKQKVVPAHTPEWKSKANIAWNSTFQWPLTVKGQIVAQFGSKMEKNWLFSRISL